MRPILIVVAAAALVMLAGCGAKDNDPGPGGVTVGEARALDDAAAMLEAQRGKPPAVTATGPAAGPATVRAETPAPDAAPSRRPAD